VNAIFSTFATIWRLAVPYFRSEDRWTGGLLLAVIVALELATVFLNLVLTWWNAEFFNSLQNKDWQAFIHQLGIFCVLAAAAILIAVYQLYLNQWLQIRWRRWMTDHYLGDWLEAGNHYRMQLLGDAADNPDQRIADDIRMFIDRTLFIGLRLLNSIVTLISFTALLWSLSSEAPLTLFGASWDIPGYLVWTALIYAAIGTAGAHLIGRSLVHLNFNQQRFEADFRFNLVRVRENSEQIALLRGETAERQRLLARFGDIISNWYAIMMRTKNLTFFSAGFAQVAIIFPYVVVSPAYFAGRVQLGTLTQTAQAFDSVRTALSFIIETYQSLAEWQSIITRLAGFDASVARARACTTCSPTIQVAPRAGLSQVNVNALDVHLPNGTPLVGAGDIAFAARDRVLVTGPSGVGKSTLFRAIGGIWPFGSGAVLVPDGARVMVLPQRPYLPVGSLAAAVTYPGLVGSFDAAQLAEVLRAVGLPAMIERLGEDAHWNRLLSLGEQQRLAVARAILHAPDFLFLDEATASLDHAAEAMLYRLLHERLPGTTIVSIGHRSTLNAFHDRQLAISSDGDRNTLREVAAEARPIAAQAG